VKGLVSGIVETRAGACIVHWLLLPDEDTVEGASFSYFSWRGVKDTLFCPVQTVTPTGLSTGHRKMEARQPKYWSFSSSTSSFSEYLGLISFRIDWFDLAT